MTKQEFNKMIEHMTPILHKLSAVPNVNRGGCAIVAVGMYKYITQKLGLKCKIVARAATIKKRNYCYSQIKRGIPVASDHYFIQAYHGMYIDSGGIYIAGSENKKFHVPFDLALRAAENPHIWNHRFRRSNVKKIDAILGLKTIDLNAHKKRSASKYTRKVSEQNIQELSAVHEKEAMFV